MKTRRIKKLSVYEGYIKGVARLLDLFGTFNEEFIHVEMPKPLSDYEAQKETNMRRVIKTYSSNSSSVHDGLLKDVGPFREISSDLSIKGNHYIRTGQTIINTYNLNTIDPPQNLIKIIEVEQS